MKKRRIFYGILAIAIVAMSYYGVSAKVADTGFTTQSVQSLDSLSAADLENINNLFPNAEWRISDVKSLPIDSKLQNQIKQKYSFNITQPIDHKNPKRGHFKQRVFIAFNGHERPTTLITEGYTGNYAANPRYNEEIASILDGNWVLVEHRYFAGSVPFMQEDTTITWEKLNWDYMTAEQEAADLHNVRVALGSILKGKWIASGISKGGQNCMAYTSFYPGDIDVSVPYVGPVARSVEDGRHEPFLRDSTGTAQDRERIYDFQIAVLKRRAALEPLLEEFSKKNNIVYNIPTAEVLDFCVLEFPFAFWQWGRKTADIPSPATATDKELFDYLVLAAGPDYFQKWDANAPFFVQAAKELGYYGYDTEPFKYYLSIKSAKGYLRKIFLPGGRKFKFDKRLYKRITKFVQTTDSKMMFIYGEWDPWSSVRPGNPGHNNIKFYIAPGGSHRARINNLPPDMREDAVSTLKKWLNIEER